MPNSYTLDPTRDTLPTIEEWPAEDSRRLLFVVTQDGSAKDISNDTVEWQLRTRPYQSAGETVLDDTDDAVTVWTDGVVDPTAGETRVDIAEGALSGEWGDYWHVVTIDPPGESRQSWTGKAVVTG